MATEEKMTQDAPQTFGEVNEAIEGQSSDDVERDGNHPELATHDEQKQTSNGDLPEDLSRYRDNGDGTWTRSADNVRGHFDHKEFVPDDKSSDSTK